MEQLERNAEILQVVTAYHGAMVSADIEKLEALVAPAHSMVHITGFVQPRDAWFAVVRSGQFVYHSIRIDEKALSIAVNGDKANLSGRGIFDATINGARSPWRLQFTLQLAKTKGAWRIYHARYSSF